MMAGWTNRGKFMMMDGYFRATSAQIPTTFYVALVTSAAAPTADTNTLSELTQVAAGNGYTSGGIAVARNSTDFDVLTEDDTGDQAVLQIKDLVWTASGGTLPASGSGARYAVLTDDNATVASRRVVAWWDLVSDRSVSSGQTLTLQNCELDITE
jgi:hypothetical protein